MKLPDRLQAYCKKCGKHTLHRVRQEKTRHRGGGMGATARNTKRNRRGYGNQGKFSKKPVTATKMASKSSKKVDLRLECPECHKKWVMSRPRTKRVEFVRTQ